MSGPMTAYTPEFHIAAAGRDWVLRRPSDFESLWDDMVADGLADADEHIPYWTELWPSSLVLSSWLEANRKRIAGTCCLDLGCGIGLTALVGTYLGADVVGIDYETDALRYATLNASLNSVSCPAFVAMDWRRPCLQQGAFDFVWGGDIMYERRFVEPVLKVCSHALKKGGRVWVAEPGRSVYDFFLRALPDFGWTGRKVHAAKTDALYVQTCQAEVAIWELARAGS